MIPLRIGTFNFECVVKQTEKPVLLVFGAIWDYKSRRLYELLETIPQRFEEKIITGTVDCDYAPDIFSECSIGDIPTMIIFEDGLEFERKVGYNGSDDIKQFIYRFYGIIQ